jgi:hypothetical protein
MREYTYLAQLRHILDVRFSDSEIRSLCFDLGIDYDNLPGQSKIDKVRELIAYMDRRHEVLRIAEYGERIRQDITWPHPSGFTPGTSGENQIKESPDRGGMYRDTEVTLIRPNSVQESNKPFTFHGYGFPEVELHRGKSMDFIISPGRISFYFIVAYWVSGPLGSGGEVHKSSPRWEGELKPGRYIFECGTIRRWWNEIPGFNPFNLYVSQVSYKPWDV